VTAHSSAANNTSASRGSDARRLVAFAALALPSLARAAGIPTGTPLEEIVVTAQRVGLVGNS
jgi:hypothetical protein